MRLKRRPMDAGECVGDGPPRRSLAGSVVGSEFAEERIRPMMTITPAKLMSRPARRALTDYFIVSVRKVRDENDEKVGVVADQGLR